MSKSTQFKSVVVKEDPKTSLAESGIYDLTLPDGARVVALGHAFFPNHDRSLHQLVLQYLRDAKPAVVLLLGGMVDENAFRSLADDEENYLHDFPDAPEVDEARQEGSFEKQVLALGESCGDFIRSFAQASGGKVVYIPSATHLSMPNEVRLMEFVQFKKRVLDNWSANHPDAPELPSDPTIDLPKQLAKLFQIDNDPNIEVTRYGAAVRLNGKTLFMIGDFRRRNAGDASKVEWEQRGLNIVRSFDGKVASSWMTTPSHTLPGLTMNHWQFHEVGYLWDPTRMGHLRDYDRRAPGFWSGVIVSDGLFGQAVVIVRGNDQRRSFIVDTHEGLVAYTEDEAGALPNGHQINLTGKSVEKPLPRPRATARKSTARKTTRSNTRRKR